MADRSITWQRTGGKTHRVVVDDGAPVSTFRFESYFDAAFVARQNALQQAACNLNHQHYNHQAQGPSGIFGALGNLGAGLFG